MSTTASAASCPKCKFPREEKAPVCPACGVIFSKLMSRSEPRSAATNSSLAAAVLFARVPALDPPSAVVWLARLFTLSASIALPISLTAFGYVESNSGTTALRLGGIVANLFVLWIGLALRRRGPRVRGGMIVLSLLQLPLIPLGTILGIAQLYFFSSEGARLYYSERSPQSLSDADHAALRAWHDAESGRWIVRLVTIGSALLVIAMLAALAFGLLSPASLVSAKQRRAEHDIRVIDGERLPQR